MNHTTTIRETRRSIPAAILWASAAIIAAMIITQAGRLPGHPAYAGMAATTSEFTLVTANGGTGGDAQPDELLYVLDSRGETLFIYQMEDVKDRRLNLIGGSQLPALFRQGRGGP